MTKLEQQNQNFSNNGKVSIRQMNRMMFLELFGLGTLILPGPLAKICQTDGVFAILVAAAIWSGIVFCCCRKVSGKARLELKHGQKKSNDNPKDNTQAASKASAAVGKLKALVQFIIFTAAAGFLMYLIVSLVERQLLESEYLWIVVLTVGFAGGYGIVTGLECRARIYEILFWILLIPLTVILVIALYSVRPDYFLPVFASEWWRFWLGVAAAFVAFLPACLCVFLCPDCDEPSKASASASKTVWRAGICIGLVYLLLLGIFQAQLLSMLKYPVISLMSVVQMPGNLMERLDAPMMIIWFFCLFALFHSLCHYAVVAFQRLFSKHKNTKRKVVIGMILIMLTGLMLLLTGCSKKGPEDNMYALAIGIEEEKDTQQVTVSYACPSASGGGNGGNSNAKGNSDGGSDAGGGNASGGSESQGGSNSQAGNGVDAIKTITVDSLFQAQEMASAESNQTIDLNHMKVFVISREYLQDKDQKDELVAYFLENENMAWNTYIFLTEEEIGSVFGGSDTNGKSLGIFLEELLKSQDDVKEKSIFTVKDFMSLYQNKDETMLVPMISVQDKKIVIDSYCILSRCSDRGTLSVSQSDYGQILLEKQKKISYLIGEETYVTVQDIRMERKMSVENGIPKQELVVKGNLKLSADWLFDRERKADVLEQSREELEWTLNQLIIDAKKNNHTDLTNSFLALQGLDRELWKLYRDNPDAYEKKLETTVKVELKMLDT